MPLLIMMGISPSVAAASGINAIVGASVSGTFTHAPIDAPAKYSVDELDEGSGEGSNLI